MTNGLPRPGGVICELHPSHCDEEGDVTIIAASDKLNVLATRNLGESSYCTPVFANATLYLRTRERLFAIRHDVGRLR
jgi:hypothetical protein